jgi:LPS-assembly protein
MISIRKPHLHSAAAQWLVGVAALTVGGSAQAIEFKPKFGSPEGQASFTQTRLKPPAPVSPRDPVVLTADTVDYDKEADTVRATGNVEIVQGETVMLCDEVVYQRGNNTVKAAGNVSVLEASGNVFFADKLSLRDDLKRGLIHAFKARMSDDSLFVAARGERVSEDRVLLRKGVYSPCKVCDESQGGGDPLWQIRADKAVIDQEEQTITYDHATMEVYGVPVFYTPYFSHPTPGADNKTGLLEPQLQQSTNLGTVYRQPLYWAIAPDRDLTFTPILTSLEGPVGALQYRQKFDAGFINFEGSATKPQSRDAGGSVAKGQDFRGHFFGEGRFDVADHYRLGFRARRTSDDTYLRRYDFSDETLLTSRVYAEGSDIIGRGTGARSSMNVQALSFEGLTAQDNNNTSPLVLPLAEVNWQSAPGFNNSRFSMSGNAMALTRTDGADTRRVSATAGWKLPYISSDGQVIEFSTQVRTDMYSVDNYYNSGITGVGRETSGETGRVIPQAGMTWRYPFIKHMDDSSLLIEPVVMVSASPSVGKIDNIPNEDSQVPEFNTSNLFSYNRFAGYDRVEGGPQMAYGLRGQAQLYSNKYIDWLIGQQYQRSNRELFPFSNDLASRSSDYVGKVGISYDGINFAYRTRLDRDTFNPKRNEIEAGVNYYPVSLTASYLSLKNDISLQNKEEIYGVGTLNLTPKWQWMATARQDMELNELTGIATGLRYNNECIDIINTLGKEYTRDRDIKPSTTYMFRVSLKNLD